MKKTLENEKLLNSLADKIDKILDTNGEVSNYFDDEISLNYKKCWFYNTDLRLIDNLINCSIALFKIKDNTLIIF